MCFILQSLSLFLYMWKHMHKLYIKALPPDTPNSIRNRCFWLLVQLVHLFLYEIGFLQCSNASPIWARLQSAVHLPTISPSSPLRKKIFIPTLQFEFMSAVPTQSLSFSLVTTLVNMSAGFFLVWIFLNCINHFSTTSLIQWYLTSMCFKGDWKIAFLLKSIALWLSQWTIYLSCIKPNSWRNCFIQSISLPASFAAIYSASIVDKATHFCNFDCHDTVPLQK